MKRNRNPRYVKQYRDGSGNWINQYRRGGALIRLPNGRDFDDNFWNGPNGYYAAERVYVAGEIREIGQARTKAGSGNAALIGFYKSTDFRNLAPASQRAYRQSLERDYRPTYGEARISHLRPKHVAAIVGDKASTSPGGARMLLNALRSFAQYCVGAELIERDPTIGIKAPKRASDVNRRRTLTPDRRPMLTPLGVGSGLSR